jgi:protein ImuB
MRFACLHVPGFLLQVHARAMPGLQGTAFAVLSAVEHQVPRLVACSRPARDAGLRPGMTATQARAVASEVRLVDGAPAAYVAAMQALGEAALALSVTVDIDTQGSVFARVPPARDKDRAAAWGEKLVEAAARVGFQGRVGIAGDRFTAWAATQVVPRARVRVVPAGGSAELLAPLGLELLPLDDGVRHMLQLLGVRTLGDFAALPPPSVGRRWAQDSVDAQALARGEDRTPLRAFHPSEPVREAIELDAPVHELEPLAFVLRPLAERAVARLSGRARAVARLMVRLAGEGRSTEVSIAPTQPTTSTRTLVDLARAHLAERTLEHPVVAVELVVVEEGEAAPGTLELFPRHLQGEADAPDPAAVDLAVARLRAAFGAEAVHGTHLVDRHRPEAAFEPVAFTLEAAPRSRKKRSPPRPRVLPLLTYRSGGSALRLVEPPASVDAEGAVGDDPPRPPVAVAIGGRRRRVAAAHGPTRLEGEWWTDTPLARDYFEVETDDGGHYWLYRDHADGRFYLHGVFD